MLHPHIHCIVPGGGLSISNKWINSNNNFFIPVKVLSQIFRAKFLYYFKQAKLQFHGSQEYLSNDSDFQNFLTAQYKKDWVVYCKPPFQDPDCVIEYLARYANRVGISNNRIVKLENGNVTFKWRDYSDFNKEKLMTVTANEFIRRFLLHILPDRFTKIRHYGLLSSRNKKARLTLCKKLTNTLVNDKPKEKISYIQLFKKLIGKDLSICPCCAIGHLRRAAPA